MELSSSSCVARIISGEGSQTTITKIRGEAAKLRKFQKRANLLVRHLSNCRTAEMLKWSACLSVESESGEILSKELTSEKNT